MRLDQLEPGGSIECSVPGCGWRAEVPALLVVLDGRNTRVTVNPVEAAAFDAYLAGHLGMHALAETLLERHPDDAGPGEPEPARLDP